MNWDVSNTMVCQVVHERKLVVMWQSVKPHRCGRHLFACSLCKENHFSAVYLAPKADTDGFTSLAMYCICVNLRCSRVKFALFIIAIPPWVTACVRIFVLCDLAKKVFFDILEQKQFKSISYYSRTKTI